MKEIFCTLIDELENYFDDDLKRINHAKAVLSYAESILKDEGGDQDVVFPSAILHDIGIKECERKYNSVSGNFQEKEGPPVAEKILKKIDYPSEYMEEILEIIGNHHSPGKVTSLNFQILYEADWLVNLGDDFQHLHVDKKEKIIDKNFKTKTGIKLAKDLFLKRRKAMGMFCFQCQETAKNTGCTIRGVCGKDERASDLMDLLIYSLQGLSVYAEKADSLDKKYGVFTCQALFSTITNANFDEDRIADLIKKALVLRDEVKGKVQISQEGLHDSAVWSAETKEDFIKKSLEVSPLSYSDNEDIRSLKSLLLYGLKGIAAYTDHASVLGQYDESIFSFMYKGLAAIANNSSADELTGLVLEAGENAVKAMAVLDKANTGAYGNPEITKVNLGVRNNPGILISGHDLKDMEELLKQTEGTGVDVYTHSEMLPANYYPAFKKYEHFVGNYGSSWWAQNQEFETFNGPILMTTNCIIPVKDSYKDRIFTTGMAGYPGVKHVPDRSENGKKDFSEIIELAKKCQSPKEIETGEIVGGFAHHQVLALAEKIVEAVKSGAIKRFIVMAGCDGRQKPRSYFTEVAEALPKDTVILTAGCAKYRYNKLPLGDINGIPRVLDAGQCNDSYSLAVIALKLKEVFGLNDINELPISFDIAWYEQKAVAVLLALLYLGVKGIRLGPTLPAFLSPNVVKVLVEKFNIKPISTVEDDVKAMMEAR
jgi:hydroxylamine reductase